MNDMEQDEARVEFFLSHLMVCKRTFLYIRYKQLLLGIRDGISTM